MPVLRSFTCTKQASQVNSDAPGQACHASLHSYNSLRKGRMHAPTARQLGQGLDRTRTGVQGNGLHPSVMAGGKGPMMHNMIGSPEQRCIHLAGCRQWLDQGVHESLGCNMPHPGDGVGPSSACDGLVLAGLHPRSEHDGMNNVTRTKHTW